LAAVRLQGLIAYFGDLESAWKADFSALGEAGWVQIDERVIRRGKILIWIKFWENIRKAGD